MRVDLNKKNIVFNVVEANFIDRVNSLERSKNLVTLSVYWNETFFGMFLTKFLKFGYRGCMMDKECYVIPEDFKGIDLSKLKFDDVVATCGFTQSCDDDADRHEGYNENYKIG